MRAIDLYAGIGGWALGLKMAGIQIIQSYEWWEPAARTHLANIAGNVTQCDIRNLSLNDLPENIDVVVGSPPCTQFSYSNRGGSGDTADGLKDIRKFFEIVRFLKPSWWAFENVPRVEKVLREGVLPGGALEEFADIINAGTIQTVDMSKFGLPQRRKRCIAGNFDFDLLLSYSKPIKPKTLGDVLNALTNSDEPNFAHQKNSGFSDREAEQPLNWEEERFNRDMKVGHPVYNGMAFPDHLDRPSRTITATCTRVSRESIIVWDGKAKGFRRLSVRERGCLQGFPSEYQFLGSSHAQKLKMIGNAIPPVFTYFVGLAFQEKIVKKLLLPNEIKTNELLQHPKPIMTSPDKQSRQFPASRRFRFAIPSLLFKSGTRFELTNIDDRMSWSMPFYYGDSKRIIRHDFRLSDLSKIEIFAPELSRYLIHLSAQFEEAMPRVDSREMQLSWSHQSDGLHPFKFLDDLGQLVAHALSDDSWSEFHQSDLEEALIQLLFNEIGLLKMSESKLRKNAKAVLVGISMSSAYLAQREKKSDIAVAAE